ncbi:MAG: hypothetical protein ACJ8GW_09700 [Massilia sp.]
MDVGTAIVVAAIIGFAIYSCYKDEVDFDDMRLLPIADAQFKQLQIVGPTPELSFDGNSAEIVHEIRGHFHNRHSNKTVLTSVSRFARNTHGQYFYFHSESEDGPYFKAISQANAKIALKRKYRPPPQHLT